MRTSARVGFRRAAARRRAPTRPAATSASAKGDTPETAPTAEGEVRHATPNRPSQHHSHTHTGDTRPRLSGCVSSVVSERGLSVDNGRPSVRPPPRQLLAPLGIIPQRAAGREEPQQPQPPAEESPTRQDGNGGFLSAAVAGYGQEYIDRVDEDACCDVLSLSLAR